MVNTYLRSAKKEQLMKKEKYKIIVINLNSNTYILSIYETVSLGFIS